MCPSRRSASSCAGEIAVNGGKLRKRRRPGAVDLRVLQEIFRTRGKVAGQLADEFVPGGNLQRVVGEALGTDGGKALGAHVAPAERSGAVGGIDEHAIRQLQDFLVEAVEEQ